MKPLSVVVCMSVATVTKHVIPNFVEETSLQQM